MAKKARRYFKAEEKVSILRRHLVDGVAVSDLCDEYGLHPNVFHRWQKEFFERGAAAFENRASTPPAKRNRKDRRIEELEAKLRKKDEVIAEILEEKVKLKKTFGLS